MVSQRDPSRGRDHAQHCNFELRRDVNVVLDSLRCLDLVLRPFDQSLFGAMTPNRPRGGSHLHGSQAHQF
jgi:hypothetical protein